MGTIPRSATSLGNSSRIEFRRDGDAAGVEPHGQTQRSRTPRESAHDASRSMTIGFENVRVERGRTTVLDVGRLEIDRGYTTLVGPNGSGKSTMLHVIAGLLSPSEGTVTFAGHDSSARRRVAYVLQSQHAAEHLLVTAREVVRLARPARLLFGRSSRDDRRVVDDVMERLGVADLANRHLADMSGGQRQRVFIAQGLAQDADILLLDEPVAGLDLASEQTIRTAIDDESSSGRTVLVATHDLDEAMRADRVVLLNGSVVAVGAPADVLRPENLRRAYRGRVLELGDGSVAVDDDHHH